MLPVILLQPLPIFTGAAKADEVVPVFLIAERLSVGYVYLATRSPLPD